MSGRFDALPMSEVRSQTTALLCMRGQPKAFLSCLGLLKVEGHRCWCLYIAIGRIHSESVDAICAACRRGACAPPACRKQHFALRGSRAARKLNGIFRC